jgi:hypothetical protein
MRKEVSIYAPNGREMFEIETSSSLKLRVCRACSLKVASGSLDEEVEETILHNFPEGDYAFSGEVNWRRQALRYGHPSHLSLPVQRGHPWTGH